MFKRLVRFPEIPPPLDPVSEDKITDTEFEEELRLTAHFYTNLKHAEQITDTVTRLAFAQLFSTAKFYRSGELSFLDRLRIGRFVRAFDDVMLEVSEME